MITTTQGIRVSPVQAAKLLVVYGGVTAQMGLDATYEQGLDTVLVAGMTQKEYDQIARHIPKQIDRVLKLLLVEHLW